MQLIVDVPKKLKCLPMPAQKHSAVSDVPENKLICIQALRRPIVFLNTDNLNTCLQLVQLSCVLYSVLLSHPHAFIEKGC